MNPHKVEFVIQYISERMADIENDVKFRRNFPDNRYMVGAATARESELRDLAFINELLAEALEEGDR